jgi:hypothetical protein
MSNQHSSSDSRVQNSDVNQLNIEGLTITDKQPKPDTDEAGPYRELAEESSAMVMESEARDGEVSHVQSSSDMFSGQASTNWYAEATNTSSAGQSQTTDQALASQMEDLSMSCPASLSEDGLQYIAALNIQKSYEEAQAELACWGLSFESLCPDDFAKIIAYATQYDQS